MLPTSWPAADYQLIRPTSRIYESFIVPTNSPSKTFPIPSRIQLYLNTPQALQVFLVHGTYSELVTFTTEKSKQTTQMFPGLTSFTTSSLTTQGGLALVATDAQGRPVHYNNVIETGQCHINRRAHPVAFSIQGQIIQSEAVVLKREGVEPFERDIFAAVGNTYTVVRVNEIRDYTDTQVFQIDLKRTSRE